MAFAQAGENPRIQMVVELTSSMVHKHYCENDVEAVVSYMDDDMIWMGAGEKEYAIGGKKVIDIFRQFVGRIPKCNISDEQYHVIQITPDVYLCTGRMWISTDSSTQISLRVHQRITIVFRWIGGHPRCCHIHVSNPYDEMLDDVGFPTKIARQSYQYIQEQIETQKRQIAEQTAILQKLSYEDSLTGLYNRNKFNEAVNNDQKGNNSRLGIACFDLNGLKDVNDRLGHSAGDSLIRRAANQIRLAFYDKVYRIGGDEFVVIDNEMEEDEFYAAIHIVQKGMEKEGISYSMGISWRSSHCSIKEQFDEADLLMYQEKRRFYSMPQNNRRKW